MKTITKVNGNTANRAQGLAKYQKDLQEIAKKAVTIKAISNQEYHYYLALSLALDEAQAFKIESTLYIKYWQKKGQQSLKKFLMHKVSYRAYEKEKGYYQYPRIP